MVVVDQEVLNNSPAKKKKSYIKWKTGNEAIKDNKIWNDQDLGGETQRG